MSSVVDLARLGASALLHWWVGELAGMLPPCLKRVGRRERRELVLLLNRGEAAVLERTGDRVRMIGTAISDRVERHAELAALVRRANRRRQPVTICLAGEYGLRKILSLPLAARDDLDQLLRFEMDRLTPFQAEEVYFAQRIVSIDTASRRIEVELVVVPRRVVEQALETAQAVGVVASRLELGAARADDREPLNLLPQQSRDAAGERRLIRALILLTLLLAIVAVAIPLQRQRTTLAALTEEVAATRIDAEQSHALRADLDALAQTGYFLLGEKGRRPMATEVLAELTRLVPDQAHLAQLTLQDNEIQLHGSAATASNLISLLDRSPLFHAPQFRSPVTQDGRDGTERFHLSVKLAADG